MQRTAKGLAGQSGFVRRPAKGTAASTSSQPQAVMDSSADTSAPLASRLAGSKSLASCLPRDIGFSIGHLSKPSSYRMRLVELSSQRRRPVNEAVPTRATPDTNRSAPGAGTPTGDFWKRSGQHEPRRVPGHGAPSIEVVFQPLRSVNGAVPVQSVDLPDIETDAASRRSCPSTSRFVRATDSTKSCHGTSVMPTSPRWPFSPSSHRPVTG